MKLAQDILYTFSGNLQIFSNLLNADFQIAALIEVANQLFGDQGVVRGNQRFQLLQENFRQRLPHRNAGQGIELLVLIVLQPSAVVSIILLRVTALAPEGFSQTLIVVAWLA